MSPVLFLVIVFPLLSSCARTPVPVAAPPMPTDIGWSTPTVAPRSADPEPTPPPPSREPTRWETVSPYQEGAVVHVDVAISTVLTFQLAADEEPVAVVVGDRSAVPEHDPAPPWQAKLGERGSKYPLVHVTVSRPGLRTVMNIPTNKRLYIVDLRSVAKSQTRLVRWTYDHEPVLGARPPRLLPDPRQPAAYHVGYTITPSAPPPVWTPTSVVDDGHKTYLFLPPNLAVMAAPMLRLLGPNGPEMSNPRLVTSVLVIDHLITQAELRLGRGDTAETVRITRGPAQTIQCPGHLACPIWPPLPSTLAPH